MIDVGQGDSILIKLPNNKGNILIDTGGKDTFYEEAWKKKKNNYSLGKNTLIPFFKSIGIRKIDYLIITHGDNDHIGEGVTLVSNFNIKNVLLNRGDINNNEEKLIKVLKNNNIDYELMKEGIININGYKLYLINNKDYNDENNNSTVFYININNTSLLFTGDISRKTELDLINKYNIKIDILKIAHHGSNTSSDPAFLDKIKPRIALISVGRNNKFNHPSKETIYELNKRKITTYLTSVHGSVKYIFDKNGTIISMPP
jgi:competence protein ComEC